MIYFHLASVKLFVVCADSIGSFFDLYLAAKYDKLIDLTYKSFVQRAISAFRLISHQQHPTMQCNYRTVI